MTMIVQLIILAIKEIRMILVIIIEKKTMILVEMKQ